MSIANKHDLFVIEDAAQGVMSTYKGKALGSIGHLAAYSFHETKNYSYVRLSIDRCTATYV